MEYIKHNIDIAVNIVNKLKLGFSFNNIDYCKLFSINVISHVLNNFDNLNLSDLEKEYIHSLYKKVIL